VYPAAERWQGFLMPSGAEIDIFNGYFGILLVTILVYYILLATICYKSLVVPLQLVPKV